MITNQKMYAMALSVTLGALCSIGASDTKSFFEVVHGWPQLPDGFALGRVSGVAVDSHNHVFVFHRGERPILYFDGASGKILGSWGDGLFSIPHGLRIDASNNLWVTDVGHHQVFKFSHDGELLMTLGAKGVPGLDRTHFNGPTEVAVMPDGGFFVADGYGNSRVAKFSAEGVFQFDWGRRGSGPGEFDIPHGVTLDSAGRLYVADRGNSRIQIFDTGGKFLEQWKGSELGRPWAVSIGPDGFLYMADGGDGKPSLPERNRALKLDLRGQILQKWGSYGFYDGQFDWAHAIACGPDGSVYVGDVHYGMRVQKFVLKENRAR
jgi:peptidylamidoglycolate lyase